MRKQDIDYILERVFDENPELSDILFTVGRPIQILQWGEIRPVILSDIPIEKLTPYQTENFALTMISDQKKLIENLVRVGYCDAGYQISKTRFRVNIFSQRGNYSIVMRKLPIKIPTIEELNLPEIVREIAKEKTGLALVTGATGSGKTSTLAAILNIINQTRPCHIITLEDPVEFVHPHIKATFNHREYGLDFISYADGLRAALRQAPHVILVGEIRDRETLEIAIQAAETGHLVLSTMHTTDAGQSIGRALGMFPPEDDLFIRLRLADNLKWVVCQRLLPKIGGGRIVATEIMRKNLRISTLIIKGETAEKTFYDVIGTSTGVGMHNFDQSIVELYKKGFITEETAITYATRRSNVIREIDKIKAEKGEKTTDIEGLKIDINYDIKFKRG